MEKIFTDENLVSTGYRCLFECVKQEGIEPVFNLFQEVQKLPKQEELIKQTVLEEENALTLFKKRNKEIINYLKEHKSELIALNFKDLNVYNTLVILLKESFLIDLYLENAKKLEKLKIANISYLSPINEYTCDIYRNILGDIIKIKKYYTDGNLRIGKEVLKNKELYLSEIPLRISNPSFILDVNNLETFYTYRAIMIKDFAFDSSKLPTEEELESYEVPRALIFKDNK